MVIILGIIAFILICGIYMLNTFILQDRSIWLKDNNPAVKLSFNTFRYLYTIDPNRYFLRLTVISTPIPNEEVIVDGEKTRYPEYCPIIFNQFDTIRYFIWNKYKRPKETYDLATSVRYAKILSNQLPLIETLTKVTIED